MNNKNQPLKSFSDSNICRNEESLKAASPKTEMAKLEKENIRTLMQVLHGCRKNCRECRAEEEEWAKEVSE